MGLVFIVFLEVLVPGEAEVSGIGGIFESSLAEPVWEEDI